MNHTICFVDPITGACTNTIESTWAAFKAMFHSKFPSDADFPGWFALYSFQRKWRFLNVDNVFVALLQELKHSQDLQEEDENGNRLADYKRDLLEFRRPGMHKANYLAARHRMDRESEIARQRAEANRVAAQAKRDQQLAAQARRAQQ